MYNIPEHQLRAKGNLSYLDLMRLVGNLWEESVGTREDGVTPLIPFRATDTALSDPDYPVIIYSLELRRPMNQEPKPRTREVLTLDDGNQVIVQGQRFDNLIKFTVVDRVAPAGAEHAEEILDTFEDFMTQMIPIYKELGLSDFFYARRSSDMQASRPGTDVVERAVIYQIVTEKITLIDVWKLNHLLITARLFREDNAPHATPSSLPLGSIETEIEDQVSF